MRLGLHAGRIRKVNIHLGTVMNTLCINIYSHRLISASTVQVFISEHVRGVLLLLLLLLCGGVFFFSFLFAILIQGSNFKRDCMRI